MMLGLCAVLGNRYQVRSNRESGRRRFDVQLAPLVSGIPGFLFEFKHTNDGHVDLDVLADSASRQIDEKKYDAKLRSAGINSVIKIGIGYHLDNQIYSVSSFPYNLFHTSYLLYKNISAYL